LNVVGIDPSKNELQVQSVFMNKIFELEESKLRWYYIVLIAAGFIFIVGSIVMLVFVKDEQDAELDEGDRYSSVYDIDSGKGGDLDGIQNDKGFGFGTGIGSGFVGAGGGQATNNA
jgi:uncharacterized membrane protein YfcA